MRRGVPSEDAMSEPVTAPQVYGMLAGEIRAGKLMGG
jgi:hypothetical protein